MPSPARDTPYTLREASGDSRDSTLMTSAPMSARYMPHVGPAMRCASSRTRTPSSARAGGEVMAATTYHSTGAAARLRASSIRAKRSRELGAQDEHDAGVVREHPQPHERPERAVDRVVDTDPKDVPAKSPLRGLPQDAGQERARQRRARRHTLVGEVPVHDEEEQGAGNHGEGHEN